MNKIIPFVILILFSSSSFSQVYGEKELCMDDEIKELGIDSVIIYRNNEYLNESSIIERLYYNSSGLIERISRYGTEVYYSYKNNVLNSIKSFYTNDSYPYGELSYHYSNEGELVSKNERIHKQVDSTTLVYTKDRVEYYTNNFLVKYDSLVKGSSETASLVITVHNSGGEKEWKEIESYRDSSNNLLLELIFVCDSTNRRLIQSTSMIYQNNKLIWKEIIANDNSNISLRKERYSYNKYGLLLQIRKYIDDYSYITYSFIYYSKNKKLTIPKRH